MIDGVIYGHDLLFHQISRIESDEIDADPNRAYELILGDNIGSAAHELLRHADNVIKEVNSLYKKHALTIERANQANAGREPISGDLLAEYQSMTGWI